MQSTFKNLLYVLRHYKLATVTNLLGLSFAFLLFMLISIHVGHEYSFDASLLNRERIFQLENKRDDGIWEANFARPQLERFIAASPYIEAAAITNNLVYSSVRFGISASEGPDARSYMEQVERITPGYTKVFGFELVAGDTDCLKRPLGRMTCYLLKFHWDCMADYICQFSSRFDRSLRAFPDDMSGNILCELVLPVIADHAIEIHLTVVIDDVSGCHL